ncbi:PREDICTED: uncharacterized protein LOC104822090 isoform X2 [Tarenaya hassleriana]|uniref:uncharacterized protein LOC104822090 isoform X2 n=1 Tax=Tarenaya hassleriana TaxID=28532 RepID=UPI00053C6101|nr:PREDICTED: uncharacterized protein LOC104822090 isoform X2 [Tarenaya hassleriana]
MAAIASSDATDGPVLSLINKRLRALRKKYNRILQMEESIAQGKTINKEQEEVLRSKPGLVATIDELEKLRAPLSAAVSEEISLAIQCHQVSSDQTNALDNKERQSDDSAVPQESGGHGGAAVDDLMNLLYFGSLFDVKSQSEFASTMLTRTHERGCCLTYDYVTDDATDLLGERDLDLISRLGSLMISRPVDSSLSHKNALERCIEHAKLWLVNSDQPIEQNANVSYAGLREKLRKIMAFDYLSTVPEMKAPVEVAAAAGHYVSFQATGVPVEATIQVEGSAAHFQQKGEDPSKFEEEGGDVDDHQSPQDEHQKDETEMEVAQVPVEVVVPEQQEQQVHYQTEQDHGKREFEHKDQEYVPRRSYQNQRGGRGGVYQNGRNQQYYEQSGGNYYQKNYYNNWGRGGRGGGQYNHHGSAAHMAGHGSSDVGGGSS